MYRKILNHFKRSIPTHLMAVAKKGCSSRQSDMDCLQISFLFLFHFSYFLGEVCSEDEVCVTVKCQSGWLPLFVCCIFSLFVFFVTFYVCIPASCQPLSMPLSISSSPLSMKVLPMPSDGMQTYAATKRM